MDVKQKLSWVGAKLRERPHAAAFIIIGLFGVIGVQTVLMSRAATSAVVVEPESGVISGCASKVGDPEAAGGNAVKFGDAATCTPPPTGTATPGAKLPITYDIASLAGTERYVATNGSDTTGNGSVGAPYATVSKAVSAAAAGDSIVIRGGIYRQGNISVGSTKPVRIITYPGETPTFNGAQSFASGWVTEGSYKYHAYTPQPVTDGSGISFTSGQNLTGDGVGKYPDQAWIGGTALKQVTAKSSVAASKFWVDQSNKRIYMLATDVNKGNIEVSQKDVFLTAQAPGTILEGIKITRFSNTASDAGVVKFLATADRSVIRNVEISDSAFMAVFIGGSSDLHDSSRIERSTITSANWMGVNATYTDRLVLDGVKIFNLNPFDEFKTSPQSGGLKTSRTRYTVVKNSDISNNRSHGLWFDQSNVDMDVANNIIANNTGTSLFFEISDDLLLINNYIKATGSAQAVKLAGSSGLKLVNNTIVGGRDPIGIYVDNRSKPGCADPSKPLCANSYGSDRDTVRPRPSTLDWMPRLDLSINNIVAHPTASSFCSMLTAMCITASNGDASAPINTVIHKADTTRGIPQTVMNGNVYVNGTSKIIATAIGSYTTTGAFSSAMAGSPVNISGLDAQSKYGTSWVNADGTPSSSLSGAHGQAVAVPSNADINEFIPAGTRHYGVTYK
ncbi:MAG TPA: right-handed parallel beta-helix repeat-containing protein [Candidatus Limnocylindrales bacterium]|nr:right-handed parallel beta-helix repeat-containing protein [Candidatus Limnocylindrales bacterium]